ncbi:5-methyltetrahydropteroyltriglutamate--homocysteine methyltransferase [Halobacteriales archaeon QS_5_70_17]|nr:MAG: 5-methyltetrahydropteroyltriglutamate--homocysteine methyltransferase [Halobacteriales archaeon QS_5_70_17]
MTELVATTTGLFPLPDWAKSELSDLKGHQKDDLIGGDESEEIEAQYDRAREEAVERQTTAGLDRIVEGQYRWDDMLAHPLAVHDAVETRGIVPGPYSLADLATDEHYGDGLLDAVADFLAGEIEAFPDHETLYVLEPSLVENAPGDGADERASEAVDRIAGATDAEVVVQPFYGALDEKVHAHLLDADVDAIGYDFVTDHEANLYNINEYGTTDSVALGLVDGQNTEVESPETIRERVAWVRENVPAAEFDTVYVAPNAELFYLPTSRFEAKLDALAEATTAAVEEVEA